MSDIDPTPAWPFEELYERLTRLSNDREAMVGKERLGDLAFDELPDLVGQVITILDDLRLEDWSRISPGATKPIEAALIAIDSTLQEALGLSSKQSDAAQKRTTLATQLQRQIEKLADAASPYRSTARARREIEPTVRRLLAEPQGLGDDELRGIANAAADRLREYTERADQVESKLRELEPLVEASRDVTAASGASDLATDYEDQANIHQGEAKKWGGWLIVAGVLATVGGVGFVWLSHTSTATTNAQVAARILLDLFVVGLLLYAVRMTSLQFRVHRHLEIVARNKAAALNTFNRLVSAGSEAEVRTAIAVVLAEAVFKSGDTGFIDAGSDHITLLERASASAAQRVS